jgi:tetratricopeptide (TPR) repeat protein
MSQTLIQLVVAWTLVGVFGFTAIATALSLVGVVKFADKKQQRTLFATLIVELVVGCLSFFLGFLKLNPEAASSQIVREEISSRKKQFEEKLEKARAEFARTNYQSAYSMVSELFKSPDLQEFFPVRDLFILNGDISSKRGFWLEAAESYGPALRLDPNNVPVLSNVGLAYRQLKRYEDAEQIYARALAVEPQNWGILNGYFNCLQRYAAFLSDHYPKIADEKFQKASDVADQMHQVAGNKYEERTSDVAKAMLFWQWKKYDVASNQYRSLANKYPNDTRFSEDLAAVLVESGEYAEAYSLFAKLAEAENQKGDISFFVGSGIAEAAAKAKVEKSKMEQALSAGLRAIVVDPKDPFGHYAVALVEWEMNNPEDAKKHLTDAINAEEQRSNNIHTYDRDRHEKYKALLAAWSKGK